MLYQVFISVICMLHPPSNKGKLVLEIKGIKEVCGNVHIGLYNNAVGFSQKETVYIGKIVEVSGQTVTVEIPALPHGHYAVSAYHDKNSNGKLDKSLLGIPTELYGFSNNARGTFGPPGFDEARFEVKSAVNKISVELK